MELTLTPRLKKIIAALGDIESVGVVPYADSLLAFVKGEVKEEDLTQLPRFGILTSLGSRQGKAAITQLVRYGYFLQTYNDEWGVYFLSLSLKGKAVYEEVKERFAAKPIKAKKSVPPFIRKD